MAYGPVILTDEGERLVQDALDAFSGRNPVPDGRTTTQKIFELKTYISKLEQENTDLKYLLELRGRGV